MSGDLPAATPRQGLNRQASLDKAAALCKDAVEAAAMAQGRAQDKSAQEAAWQAVCASMEAMNTLVGIGAASPMGTSSSKPDAFDLSALSSLDSPEARLLLALLRQAQAVAERVDAARGRALPADIPLQQDESRGTDLAESISELVLRLRIETEGPKGRE